MKRFSIPLSGFMCISTSVQASPMPEGFSERIGIIVKECGAMPHALIAALVLVFITTDAAIIYYILKGQKM